MTVLIIWSIFLRDYLIRIWGLLFSKFHYFIFFNKKDEEILSSKLNQEACVELKNIIEESVDKRDKSDYELLRVIR